MYLIHHNACAAPAKPFVKWVGGKGQLLPTLKKSLPEKILAAPALTYVEPFVGGGAMLFHLLPALKNVQRAVINDINPDLMQTYVTVRDHLSGLLDALKILQNEYHTLQAKPAVRAAFLFSSCQKFPTLITSFIKQHAINIHQKHHSAKLILRE